MMGWIQKKIRLIKLKYKSGEVEFTSIKPNIKGNLDVKVLNGGRIKLGSCLLNKNIFLCAAGGQIILEDDVTINRNSILVAREEIFIGQGSSIGPNVCIYDHDHVFGEDGFSKKEFTSQAIKIGKNVWIGANVIILKGAYIGDGCVVGAGTVVKGVIPSHSIIYNEKKNVIKQLGE